jgi:hypothetical protein
LHASFPPFTTLIEPPLSPSTPGNICPESSSLEPQSSNAHDVATLESPDSTPSEAPAHTSPPALRRSTWVKSLPSHLQDFHCFHAYREASTNPLWQDAMKEELDALHKNHTWDLVDLPQEKSVVGVSGSTKSRLVLVVLLTDTRLAL